jgi:TatA/E family protein of Tat protein translocase
MLSEGEIQTKVTMSRRHGGLYWPRPLVRQEFVMGPIGIWELVIIFVVALLVFGPRKLPELGKSLGKSLAEFKRASNELRNTLDDEIRQEERAKTIPPPASAPAPPAATADPTSATTADDTLAEPSISNGDAPSTNAVPDTVARGQHGS